jgi:hypothetical protein
VITVAALVASFVSCTWTGWAGGGW